MGHSPNQQTQTVTCSPTGSPVGAALFTTATPHTLFKNQPVILSGTTAPSGFTNGTTYYVVAYDGSWTDTTFSLSATPSGPAIVASSAGSAESVGMPTGTFRVLRINKIVEEQWLTGQANASAAKVYAKNPTQGNQNQFWLRRHVYQFIGTGGTSDTEDVFEYVVSAQDDGT